MTCTLYVAWDDRLAGYDLGPGHPLAPLRLTLTMELARALGLERLDGVTVEVPARPNPGACGSSDPGRCSNPKGVRRPLPRAPPGRPDCYRSKQKAESARRTRAVSDQ